MEMDTKSINFFTRYLSEAPDETPPDVAAAQEDSGTPDVPENGSSIDAGPPDMPDDVGEETTDDGPPDLDDNFDDGFGGDNTGDEDNQEGDGSDDPEKTDLGLDEKVSAIMNQQLYQRFLNLISSIANQLTMIKNNNDILYTLSEDTLETESSLKKLDENIRLYIKYNFVNENYSKNLLFFNKCLNLLKLLNDAFDKNIRKGIKDL